MFTTLFQASADTEYPGIKYSKGYADKSKTNAGLRELALQAFSEKPTELSAVDIYCY